MNEVLKTVFDANLATLLIVASLAFLFIAVAGSVAGKIDPGKAGRIGAGLIQVREGTAGRRLTITVWSAERTVAGRTALSLGACSPPP